VGDEGSTRSANLAGFRSAGRTLFSLGLVKEAEGNLSTFDGNSLAITRAGATLADLSQTDVLTGELDAELPGASSDVEVHRNMYRDGGRGAVAHAHPPGTVPERGGGPGEHGVYAFADTLAEAVEAVVAKAREAGAVGPVSR
jgi:ribulose-5-phosphate 4-epimerase/fuculose-1-phosphate aldolase